MDIATLIAFAAAFFVFAASPGPDNMTIVARTISGGAASGIAYGAGTVVGILIFLVLAAFGLSVIAAKMAVVMTVLRYGGAAYLIWMGVRLWTAVPVVPELQPVAGGRGLLTIFATGIALNLGNPKMPLFYVALLPNVVGASLTSGRSRRADGGDPGRRGGGDRRPRHPCGARPQPVAHAQDRAPREPGGGRRDDRRRRRRGRHALRSAAEERADHQRWRRPSSACRHLLPVNGRRRLAATLALILQRWRLAKSVTSVLLSVHGEKIAAAR